MRGVTADKKKSMEPSEKVNILAILIVAAGFLLRLYHLGHESLWIDEGFSLRDATNLNLMGETRPLYFAFLKWWLALGAHSEFMMRLPSVIFGTAAIWLMYIVGKRLIDNTSALIASAFMAVSVLQINHSQEVRMYSLTVFIILLSTYLLISYLVQGKSWMIAAYAVSAFAGLLTFPLTVLILGTHGLFALLYVKAYKPRSYIVIGGLVSVVAIWIPWLYNNMAASGDYGEGYTSILDKPGPAGIISLLGKFFLLKWTGGHISSIMALAFSIAITLVAVSGIRKFNRADRGLAFAILWLVIPVSSMAIMSYILSNMWMVHYMITAAPAFYLLVAKGINSLGSRKLAFFATAAIFAFTLGRLGIYYMKPSRPQWQTAITYITSHSKPGDVIALYYSGNRYVFNYYYHGMNKWSVLGSDVSQKGDFAEWNNKKVEDLLSNFPFKGKRLWLVLSHHTYRGGFAIIDYCKNRYKTLDYKNHHLLEFYLFDGNGKMIPDIAIRKVGKGSEFTY